jgi:DNA-binding response OmpR family regulator
MHILLVEDQKSMAVMLKRALQEKGHAAVIAYDGSTAIGICASSSFDVIVLDLMLPDMDGFTVARTLREASNRTPILVLTARDTVADMVRALDLGADDYLTKPFALAEFMARVRAMGRRGPVEQPVVLRAGELSLDSATQIVRRGERVIPLTRTEYLLLEFLLRRPGRVLSRQAIIDGVWGAESGTEENTLEAFIKLLRAKVDSGQEGKLIQTVRGMGYRLHTEGGEA